MCKQLGFMNIMHDKRVFRGSNFSKNRSAEIQKMPPAHEALTHRQAIVKKRSIADQDAREWRIHQEAWKISKTLCQQIIKKSPAARKAERESLLQELTKEKAMYKEKRAMQLHRKTQKMSDHLPLIQTMPESTRNLEKLNEHPQSLQTFGTQTKEDNMFTKSIHEMRIAYKDASTQVDEKEFDFDFDAEVVPIMEILTADVLRQVTIEKQYQYKLAARSQQQRTLHFECITVDLEMFNLERKDVALRKIISEQIQLFNEGKKNEKARISKLPPSYSIDFVPGRVPGDLSQTVADAYSLKFVSWLTKELEVMEQTKKFKIEDILNEK